MELYENGTTIIFKVAGNSILGQYSHYRQLVEMLKLKRIAEPFGYTLTLHNEIDARALIDFINLFASNFRAANQLQAWEKACKYAKAEFYKTN